MAFDGGVKDAVVIVAPPVTAAGDDASMAIATTTPYPVAADSGVSGQCCSWVIVKLEQETVAPLEIARDDRFRSAPDVPTDPVRTTVVPSDFRIAKYPAVPVFPAVAEVIAFAVAVTVPALAVGVPNAVADMGRLASSVPVIAPFRAGCDPV